MTIIIIAIIIMTIIAIIIIMDNILQRLKQLEDKVELLSRSCEHRHVWHYYEADHPQKVVKYQPQRHFIEQNDRQARCRQCQICALQEEEIWEWCTEYAFWKKIDGNITP